MVRAPCCEKMGVKKGPWTPEEDQVLISYIQKYGHGNWRALPKKAGLLRCGKSCRLRWINYLRPDIKRGNFSWEEEETIIKLHERLGNRWSAIAAQLPGRTDNEIKNVWHTHLKKRLKQKPDSVTNGHVVTIPKCDPDLANDQLDSANSSIPACQEFEAAGYSQMSPQSSSSCDRSLVTEASVSTAETEINMATGNGETFESSEIFPIIDENFWSEPDNSSMENNLFDELIAQFPDLMEPIIDDDKDFWYNVFVKAGGIDG